MQEQSADSRLTQHLTEIVTIARHAPSVHNTQPWLVSGRADALQITIDKRYALQDGDPTGRETVISLGIFVEALSVAAGRFGLQLVTADYADGVAHARFTSMAHTLSNNDIELLQNRSSDRSIYSPFTLPSESVTAIEQSRFLGTTTVTVVTDKHVLQKIADLTAKAIAVALTSPGFRRELVQYLVLPSSKKKRGIAVNSLYIPKLLAVTEPLRLRMGLISGEASLEKKRWLSASGVVLILAKGDMPRYWFDAGRTYLRASLAIESLGLSQATSAALVEASNYHEDIEALLGTNQRILAVLRIGKGHPRRRHSPRVEAEALITSN